MARDLFVLLALLAACWMKTLDKQHNSFLPREGRESQIHNGCCYYASIDVECEELITYNTIHVE